MADEPPSLPVGTGVSAKYKGAFCEAKIRKVVRSVKCKVLFKNGLGSYTVGDDQIKGSIRTGATVEVRHPEKKEHSEATITKIQDCSQYTVVFDDGDITTLRRTALCLKSGKHFAESETLDQLPLTHPEHFSTPVIGGRRGRRTRIGASEASSDEEGSFHHSNDFTNFKETEIGRVVCVEGGEKRKNRDNWFPGLIVAPTAQESVPIRVRDEYLVRSFKDGRYYTVPKKEITEFNREIGSKAETNSLKTAVEKALQFIDRDELPLHWDRELLLYGVTDAGSDSEPGDENEYSKKATEFRQSSLTSSISSPAQTSRAFHILERRNYSTEFRQSSLTSSISSPAQTSRAFHILERRNYSTEFRQSSLTSSISSPANTSRAFHIPERRNSSDDEPREKKDHFVAQLYKFMDENGTPINEEPVIGSKDVDLFRLYKVVHNLGGFNRVTNQNNWKNVSVKLGFGHNPVVVGMVKQSYRKYLLSFEEWPKRPGCSMQIQPRLSRSRSRIGRSNVIEEPPCPSPSIKIDKDKSVDKNMPITSVHDEPVVSKEALSKSSPAIVPIKDFSAPSTSKAPGPSTIKPSAIPLLKEKSVNKKTAINTIGTTTPVKPASDNISKQLVKEIKIEPGLKLRNPKFKNDSEPIFMKQNIKVEIKADDADPKEPPLSVAKEKKKKTVPRVQKKEIPLVKGGKVDCLANSRQKRVIKERLKTVAESIKVRHKNPPMSLDGCDKNTPSKAKAKDESSLVTKPHKKEEAAITTAVSEEKRKGRKRKDTTSHAYDELPMEFFALPTYKLPSLGDKLKVYYGPTKEQKVTSYEAKVLSTKEENGETLYFVHYTGWNTRYDEWIRSNRIADNLSWVPARASKKQAMAPNPKTSKREKKSVKTESLKGENKSGKDVVAPLIGGVSHSSKEPHSNRQGSVGRSTTPSSVASSSGRSKGNAQKRPATRAIQHKKGDEMEDSESEMGSEVEDSKISVVASSIESNASSQCKSRKVELRPKIDFSSSHSSTVIVKLEKDDCADTKDIDIDGDEEDGNFSLNLEVSSEDLCPKDIKSEVEDQEEDDNSGADDDNTKDDTDEFELFVQENLIKEEETDDSTSDEITFDDACPSLLCKDEGFGSKKPQSEDDDVVGKCRSDGENSNLAVEEGCKDDVDIDIKVEVDPEPGICECPGTSELRGNVDVNVEDEVEIKTDPSDIVTEDVYEFKEPEPFEFEARKCNDDKGKAGKRTISLSVEDKPSSSELKISSPCAQEPVVQCSFQAPSDLLKEDNSPECTPTIQLCEEAFDKICASPLRAATLDSGHIKLENLENDEDDDNFDDDSEDRLVISERDSDNCSNTSLDKDSSGLAAKYSNFVKEVDDEPKDSSHPESHGKDQFPKDDEDEGEDEEEEEDEDEVDEREHEAINNAIQTVLNLETSDESSEEEELLNEETTVPVTEVQSEKVEGHESSSENQEDHKLPPLEEASKTRDNAITDPTSTIEEEEEVKDEVVATAKPEEDQKESAIIDTCPDPDKPEESGTLKNDEIAVEPVTGENADIEEDENNIESLICEETIPGSPPSHLEVLNQIEEKLLTRDEDMFKREHDATTPGVLDNADNSKEVVQVIEVGRSPPTTAESDAYSTPSPSRESELPVVQVEKKPDKEVEAINTEIAEASPQKKENTKIPANETRPKKQEVKVPSKRGRKSKKKSDDTTSRKKYSKHGKHQGSESDDGFDAAGGTSRADPSRSRSPHPYRQNFLIPADKMASLDVGQRISQISLAMQELRTTYNNFKTELAAVDKRRKRIRRREREDAARLVKSH